MSVPLRGARAGPCPRLLRVRVWPYPDFATRGADEVDEESASHYIHGRSSDVAHNVRFNFPRRPSDDVYERPIAYRCCDRTGS